MYLDMKNQFLQLDRDLRRMIEEKYFGPEFDQKEREIRHLKTQIDDADKHRRTSQKKTKQEFPFPFPSVRTSNPFPSLFPSTSSYSTQFATNFFQL